MESVLFALYNYTLTQTDNAPKTLYLHNYKQYYNHFTTILLQSTTYSTHTKQTLVKLFLLSLFAINCLFMI